MNGPSKLSTKRSWLNTFQAAFEGIAYALRTQRNMRVHLAIALFACLLGIAMDIGRSDWMWLGLCIALVMAAELINTAVESVVDLVMPEWNPLAKAAKDTAAGAVLIVAIFAVVVGIVIFAEPILAATRSLAGW
ncbi:diacylglycerol kinase family protein [Paenibacillus marinisediminis]